ncbi:hypothetical protein BDV96DRAFT_370030 [Lophiotrema nucula]|uniref:Uncharacterized protein n=1 Tax=Lophiotrema nucula TaxID=690887 RepID=A0A6A5ZHU4_9PLEO|nr:hypothetical protein BDV96DRAFT_370030 [Lophiotrema nucula]
MRQATSLSSLAALASVVLPLSLAAGTLSMRSWLNKHHLSIYNFFSVSMILSTLALVLYPLIRAVSRLRLKVWYSKSSQWSGDKGEEATYLRIVRFLGCHLSSDGVLVSPRFLWVCSRITEPASRSLLMQLGFLLYYLSLLWE